MQQETKEQKGQIDDVEVDRVQRFAGLHKVADQVGAADENNQPIEDRGMFEPLARSRFRDWHRRFDLRFSENDAEIARRFAAPGGRRDQPHDGSDDAISTATDARLCHRKIVCAERDDSARDHAAVRDDLADLRLQRSRCRHLQRGRSAEALRPDAAEPEEAGGARARDSRRPRRGARFLSRAPR